MAKRRSDPRVAYLEVKVQLRESQQSSGTGPCGNCRRSCGYRARGVSNRGRFVLSRNPGYKTRGVAMWLNVVLTPSPPPGSLLRRKSSGTGPSASYGYCSPLCPAGGQYSGKICFIEKPGVQDESIRNVAKRSSDPREAYQEVKVQVRDLVRVVGIVAAFFTPRGSVFGENSFYRAPG